MRCKISPNDAIRAIDEAAAAPERVDFQGLQPCHYAHRGSRFAHAFVETTVLEPVTTLADLELVSCDFRCACRSRAS